MYIVQKESANKVITKIMTTQNAKSSQKTSSYANMLPSEKLISDSPSRTEISSASKVALCLSLSSASCR